MAHHALGGLGLLGLGLGRQAGRMAGRQGGYAAHPQATTSPLQDATSLLMKALGTLTFNELYYLGSLLGVPEGAYTPEMLTPNQGPMASRAVIFQQILYLWLQYLPNLTWDDLVRALHRMGKIHLAFRIWIEYMTSSQTNQDPPKPSMLIELIDVLKEIPDKSKVGNVLKIPSSNLKRIHKTYQGSVIRYRAMLSKYLLEHAFTWEGIVRSLVETKHEKLAKDIWIKYITPCYYGGVPPPFIPFLPLELNQQPTLSDLTLKFYNIGLDWFVLGICLYISEEELLRIDKENNNEQRKCIIKLFSYWLKLRHRGNWNDILAAFTHAGDREYAISIMSDLKTEDTNRKGPLNPFNLFQKHLVKYMPNLDWYIFGVVLDIPLLFLDEIEIAQHGQTELCTLEIVDYVHRTNSETTWSKISDALYRMREYGLAMDIITDHKLPVPYELQTVLQQRQSGQDLELSTDERIELQEIRESLHVQYEIEQTLKAKIDELLQQIESVKQEESEDVFQLKNELAQSLIRLSEVEQMLEQTVMLNKEKRLNEVAIQTDNEERYEEIFYLRSELTKSKEKVSELEQMLNQSQEQLEKVEKVNVQSHENERVFTETLYNQAKEQETLREQLEEWRTSAKDGLEIINDLTQTCDKLQSFLLEKESVVTEVGVQTDYQEQSEEVIQLRNMLAKSQEGVSEVEQILEQNQEQLENDLKVNISDMAIQTDIKVDLTDTAIQTDIKEYAEKFTQTSTDQLLTSDQGSSLVILFIYTLFTLILCLPYLEQDIASIPPLPGVDVLASKKLLVVGGQMTQLHWDDFGLRIDIPDNALPSGILAEIVVRVSTSGPYVYSSPDYWKLASSIYWISSTKDFINPIKLGIWHNIRKFKNSSQLRFVTASDEPQNGKYTFLKTSSDSYFDPKESYGYTFLNHFSAMGVESTEEQFSGCLYHRLSKADEVWEYSFLIYKESSEAVHEMLLLRNGYNSWTRDSLPITVEFDDNDIAMDLTTPQFDKWKIIARYPPPKYTKNRLQSGEIKSNMQLFVIWEGELSPKSSLIQLPLQGAKQPTSITFQTCPDDDVQVSKLTAVGNGGSITSNVNSMVVHLQSVTEFLPFCVYLEMDFSDCRKIETERQGEVEEQKIVMVQKWLEGGDRNWRDFIRPFALLGKCTKAKELSNDHSVYHFDPEVLKMCTDINSEN